jgi:hypothetical protein
MESVSGMEWNQCPLSRGIGVRIALEYSDIAVKRRNSENNKKGFKNPHISFNGVGNAAGVPCK